jgi:hypothetical protein
VLQKPLTIVDAGLAIDKPALRKEEAQDWNSCSRMAHLPGRRGFHSARLRSLF